jgi:hypothetical protein
LSRVFPGIELAIRESGSKSGLTPKTPSGAYKNKLFQRLTEDVGHPKLREHMSAVLMLMKYSPHWRVFMDRLDREFPQWGTNFLLPFPEGYSPPGLPPAPNFINE